MIIETNYKILNDAQEGEYLEINDSPEHMHFKMRIGEEVLTIHKNEIDDIIEALRMIQQTY